MSSGDDMWDAYEPNSVTRKKKSAKKKKRVRPNYKVWYDGDYAGDTKDINDLISWAWGKNFRKMKIIKDNIEVSLCCLYKNQNSDALKHLLLSIGEDYLPEELFEL